MRLKEIFRQRHQFIVCVWISLPDSVLDIDLGAKARLSGREFFKVITSKSERANFIICLFFKLSLVLLF